MRAIARLVQIAICVAGVGQIALGAMVPVKAMLAQMLLERAFDRSVATHRPQKPWPWADMAPIGRLSVPRLGIDRVILDSGSGQAMAFGPTLLPGGAGIGRPGTIVLAAHRDTHFRFLEHVRGGDRIVLRGRDGGTRSYRVTGSEVVRWDSLAIDRGGPDELDLATCYPFGAVTHGPLRYVVRAVADTGKGCVVPEIGPDPDSPVHQTPFNVPKDRCLYNPEDMNGRNDMLTRPARGDGSFHSLGHRLLLAFGIAQRAGAPSAPRAAAPMTAQPSAVDRPPASNAPGA